MAATYTEQLADFVIRLRLEDIPAEVRERTALLLLDALGVAYYNSDKPFVRMLLDVVDRTSREGPGTVIGTERRYVPEAAAQINSSAIHGNDFDATHVPAIMHTSTVIVPTALAVAEETGATGAEVVTAMVAGCEVLVRMGLAARGAMHRAGFQSTALCAPVVLCLLAGRLYRIPHAQIVSAAGLSASLGAGLRAFSDDGTWGKRVITGWACRAALTAVALARAGYPGTRDVLEKEPFGFYRAFMQKGGYDLSELTKGLGSDWTTRDIDIKHYPCSHGHHAFVDTARRARRGLGVALEDIRSVELHVSSEARKWWFEPRERKYVLPDVYGSRFSMPFTTALALVFGELKDEYLDSRTILDDPRVIALAARVVPKVDDTLNNENPNRLPGTLAITTCDGRTTIFRGTGHPTGADAFKEAVLEKFRLNTERLQRERADAIIGMALDIERKPSVEPLMALLRG